MNNLKRGFGLVLLIAAGAAPLRAADCPGFGLPPAYGVGSLPYAVVVADFDGDGHPDLATANSSGDSVSVLLNDGTGAFEPATSYAVGAQPWAIAVGDFNKDGKPDLVTANANNQNVSVLLGDGTGGFGAAANFGVGVRPHSVGVADFNGDGKLDIVTANNGVSVGVSNVSVLLGDGTGSFGTAASFAAGVAPASVAVGDFDGDGKADLAVAGATAVDNVRILLGNGDGTFDSAMLFSSGGYPDSITAADFDGDGKPDLAVANNELGSGNVGVMLGDGTGSFSTKVNLPMLAGNAVRVVSGDLNGDGRPDLVAQGEGVSIFLNAGGGDFGPAANFGVAGGPTACAIADFDSDGTADLAVANQVTDTVSILRGDGVGRFRASRIFAANHGPVSVTAADLNSDGYVDLAVANDDSSDVSILLGNGAGRFGAPANFGVGTNPSSIAVADFNADGYFDLAVANLGSDDVSILLGDGEGGFGTATSFGAGDGPISIATGDFNADDNLDLAVADDHSDKVTILYGDGDGGFGSPASFDVGGAPWSLAVKDLNDDGRPDIAVANYYDDNVSILLNDGNGGFAATTKSVGTSPWALAIADLDGDGAGDLVVTNDGSDDVSVLINDGAGGFADAVNVAVGAWPETVVIEDFDGDGFLDLAVGNYADDTVSILIGDGAGGFGSPADFPVRSAPWSMAAGLFNGDARADLALVAPPVVDILLNSCGECPATKPTITPSGPTTWCGDGSVTLTASDAASYDWSSGETTKSITVGAGGVYAVTITDADGCTAMSDPVTVTVAAPAATVSGSATICARSSTQIQAELTGTPPWSLTWSDGLVQNGITTTPWERTVSPRATTTYELTSFSDATCTGTFDGSAVVEVAAAPKAVVSGSTTICPGGSATLTVELTGKEPWSIVWSDDSTPQEVTESPYQRIVHPTESMVYSITSVSNASCGAGTARGSARIKVAAAPSATITAPTSVCAGSTGNIASVPKAKGNTTYTWVVTNGAIESGQGTSSLRFTAGASGDTTTVSVTVTNASGCSATDEADVTLNTGC